MFQLDLEPYDPGPPLLTPYAPAPVARRRQRPDTGRLAALEADVDARLEEVAGLTVGELQARDQDVDEQLDALLANDTLPPAQIDQAKALLEESKAIKGALRQQGQAPRVAAVLERPAGRPTILAAATGTQAKRLPAILGIIDFGATYYCDKNGWEKLRKGCFASALQTGTVDALLNHDRSLNLGTTEAELILEEDAQGVGLLCYLRPRPGPAGERLVEEATRRSILGMSWKGATVSSHVQHTWDEGRHRAITVIEETSLLEVSFLTSERTPACRDTAACLVSSLQNPSLHWGRPDRELRRLIDVARKLES